MVTSESEHRGSPKYYLHQVYIHVHVHMQVHVYTCTIISHPVTRKPTWTRMSKSDVHIHRDKAKQGNYTWRQLCFQTTQSATRLWLQHILEHPIMRIMYTCLSPWAGSQQCTIGAPTRWEHSSNTEAVLNHILRSTHTCIHTAHVHTQNGGKEGSSGTHYSHIHVHCTCTLGDYLTSRPGGHS